MRFLDGADQCMRQLLNDMMSSVEVDRFRDGEL